MAAVFLLASLPRIVTMAARTFSGVNTSAAAFDAMVGGG